MAFQNWVRGANIKLSRFCCIAFLASAALSSCLPGAPASPTRTPLIGMAVFGVRCEVPAQGGLPPDAVLDMDHGETKGIGLVDPLNRGEVTDFRIGSVAGAGNDADASEIEVSQKPDPSAGWSTLPGVIQIVSNAVDSPPRTESYYINVLLGGYKGADHIVGGNLWCLVNVRHIVTPTPTGTALPTPTPSPTPEPPFIITEDGFRVTYTGRLQAQTGETLEATFMVTDSNGQPAQGEFFATLGDPPTDSRASDAHGELDAEGIIQLTLDVNWPVGVTKLYFSFRGQVYEVAEITINP